MVPAEPETPATMGLEYRCDLPVTAQKSPHFAFDSAELNARGMRILNRVARCLLDGPLRGKHVTVLGYADPRGRAGYNLELGMARASAVREYLIRCGVPSSRIRAASTGERYARGQGPAGWWLDRRTELELDSAENAGGWSQ